MLALAYVLVLGVVALEIPLLQTFSDRVGAEIRAQATSEAELVAASAAEPLARGRTAALGALVATAGRSTRGRVLVVDAAGLVVADSGGSREVGSRYGSRAEVAAALRGRPVVRERESSTLDQRLLATAVPVLQGGRTVGAVRITQSVAAARRAERRVILQLLVTGGVVLAAGLLAGAIIARQLAAPMRRLKETARRVASGELDVRARLEGAAEQRELAASFNEMTDRLAALVDAQRRFAADASHHLRTPLSVLRLRLEDALTCDPHPDAAEQLRLGTWEVDRLTRTIDDLLVLGQAESGETAAEPVDLDTQARLAIDRWRRFASTRDVDLTLEGDGDAVRAAAPDVARILDVMIENAIQYTEPGSRVSVVVDGTELEVRDEGPGFAPGELDEVFERFYRGRAGAQRPGGSGLGLAIARTLARRWQGEVTVANRPEGGADTRLRLGNFANR